MPFARPTRSHPLPPWHGKPTPAALTSPRSPAPVERVPGPSRAGSALALFGLLCTAVAMFGDKPEELARSAAYGTAISIGITLIADFQAGLRNLLRPDVLALAALYVLTLFEFLFPQPEYNSLSDLPSTHRAIIACLWGLAGLIAGRHIRAGGYTGLSILLKRPVPVRWLVVVFVFCLFLGILHMLVAVDFDFIEMLAWCTGPRFTQPWTRGRLGDWRSLLNEFAMLLYLIPPIAGIAYARARVFSKTQLAVITFGFALVMFIGFSSGTRNLFVSHLLTFLIGYAFAFQGSKKTVVIAVIGATAAVAVVGSALMLNFRNIGLKDWLKGNVPRGHAPEKLVHVDMNLFVISQLVATFPTHQPYLGLEVPYLALIRPIPRAIWPGKPEGMSMSLEQAAGAEEAWTVAASFVGEAYLAGGMIAVLVTGVFFGVICAWWSRLASPENSEVGILVYASGFFAAAISMRSLFVFTTALLPTLSAIFLMRFLVQKLAARARHLLRPGGSHRIAPPRPAMRAPRETPPRGPRG